MARINLGDKAKDIISGFTGIVFGRYEYLNGCVRYELSPDKLKKDGDLQEGRVFDEGQIVVVKAKAVKAPIKEPTGGPVSNKPAPQR